LSLSRPAKIRRLEGKSPARLFKDELAAEEPLELRVNGDPLAVLMRSPGDDRELCAGFLLSEGIIRFASEISLITRCEDAGKGREENVLNALLAKGHSFDPKKSARNFFASSSCGLCGKASIDAITQRFKPLKSRGPKVGRALLGSLPALLGEAQAAFKKTGGLHASALFDIHGGLLGVREDVGRHNALDKLIGHGVLNGLLPYSSHVLLVSGRTSFEILQKSLSARIPIVAGIGAPSSLAVDFAKESGQTLLGFLRPGSMNVYSHPGRVRS
jgi:FdhD protein